MSWSVFAKSKSAISGSVCLLIAGVLVAGAATSVAQSSSAQSSTAQSSGKQTPPRQKQTQAKAPPAAADNRKADAKKADSSGESDAPASIAEREGLKVTNRKAIFIFINLREIAPDHFTPEDADELRANLFEGEKSVDAVYNHASFGQLRFREQDVLIADPVTLDFIAGCPLSEYRTQAIEILRKERKIEANDFHHKFFLLPSGKETESGCRFNPVSFVGAHGRENAMTATSTVFGVFTLVHEMGHNMGFNHAKTDRNDNGFDVKEETDRSYGDGSCVMGSSTGLKSFNAPHVDQAGWLDQLPSPTRVTIEKPGKYEFTIVPLGRDPWRQAGTQVVRVPRGQKSGEYYYFSFRETVGVDTGLKEVFLQGANVHWAANPGKASYLIRVLEDKETFRSAAGDLTVRQLSHQKDGVHIEIEYQPK